ncbi:hypothetical protein BK132_07230 [Paenibacillus sp. FSL H8-0259]|nr:hypothetical protein BK132_07230 [Paenibacillus sp. FSL H8-0259]
MKAQCKNCNFCKQHGRVQTQQNRLGRKKYFCEHPDANKATDNTFVGFGNMDYSSPLVIKTAKRWCPLITQMPTASK